MQRLKGLFISDLVTPTGFSTVAHNIIKNIEEDIDITGLGVNYRGDPHGYNFPIYPASTGPSQNVYGIDRAVSILNSTKFDFVYILNDSWSISYYLSAFKANVKNLPKIVVYFPVDSEMHDLDWYKDFDIVSKAFTYTEFGKRVINECVPTLDVGVIPHGVDSGTFYKLDTPREELRKSMFGEGSSKIKNIDELFIVLNANRNQPRKKLDVTIQGFSLFAKGKPNARLYMHSGVRDSAIDTPKEATRYGIDDKLIVTNLLQGVQRIDADKLNIIYNACDVGINTSLGEGWGLCNMEHAVSGAAQVVPNHSACAELFSDCGLLMEDLRNITFDGVQTIGKLTTPEEVARNLEILYNNRELLTTLGKAGMEKFTQPKYQWFTIAQQWKEVFEEVCKK